MAVSWTVGGHVFSSLSPDRLEHGIIDGDRYFSKLPISDIGYRKTSGTLAKATVDESPGGAVIILTDDYGLCTAIEMTGLDREWLNAAKAALARGGLLVESNGARTP